MNEFNNFFVEVIKDIIADLGSRAIRKIIWAVVGDSAFSYILLKIDFLQLSKTKGNMVAVIAYFFMGLGIITLALLIIYSVKKKNKEESSTIKITSESKLTIVPRNGKIHEGLWEGFFTWLEIDGALDTSKYFAVLKKLESEKDGAITNHLVKIAKSSSPRLRITDEKVFITVPDSINTLLALKQGTSRPLPKEIQRFYFEVDLLKGEKVVKDFKGYLIDGYPSWYIETAK